MTNRVIRTSAYQRDLAGILWYFLNQHAEQAGDRFVDAVDQDLAKLSQLPHLGHPWQSSDSRLASLRCWPIHGFENYLVFYRLIPEGILVQHLFHGNQDIQSLLSARIKHGPSS